MYIFYRMIGNECGGGHYEKVGLYCVWMGLR